MKSKYKTVFWLLTAFTLPSILKVLFYQYKKMRGKLDYKKRFTVKFKHEGEQYEFVLRENGDDFAILRGTFMSEVYDVGQDNIKTIFDCGSHIGCVAIYYAKKYPDAQVHCFDPNMDSVEMSLINNKLNNTHLQIHTFGISDKTEDIRFNLNERNPSYSNVSEDGEEIIGAISIDEAMKSLGVKQIDLLKLDIEGCEIKAFEGMKNNFQNVKTIINENHTGYYSLDKMREVIEEAGYTILPEPKIWEKIYGVKNSMYLCTNLN